MLEEESRQGVIELLQAPLINDRSMARQMLNSWAGRRLLDQVGDLVLVDGDVTGQKVQETLEALNEREEVSTIDLLEALPAERVHLDLDALLTVARSWRRQAASAGLGQKPASISTLGQQPTIAPATSEALISDQDLRRVTLAVDHRDRPLQLQLWSPSAVDGGLRRHWLVLMPGLGGSPDHFRWLGRSPSRRGWSVLVLEHPGSDAVAVQALLEGRLPHRERRSFPIGFLIFRLCWQPETTAFELPGERLVLAGHSLGALTALLAAGARPQEGLARRRDEDPDDLPVNNLSRLLQSDRGRGASVHSSS